MYYILYIMYNILDIIYNVLYIIYYIIYIIYYITHNIYIYYILYVIYYLRPYRGSPAPPPLRLVLYACSGLLSMRISVVAVMAAFGVKLGPRWSQVRALLEPSWAKLGLLEEVWGPCWAQKSVLGALLG